MNGFLSLSVVLTLAGLAMPAAVFGQAGEAHPATDSLSRQVVVVQVPDPAAAVDEARRSGLRVADLLGAAAPSGLRAFIIVATRTAGWIGEIPPAATTEERNIVLTRAAAVTVEAAREPVVSPNYQRLLAGLERQVRSETAGLAAFRIIKIAASDLGVTTAFLPAVAPAPSPDSTSNAGHVPRPSSRGVLRSGLVILIVVTGLLGAMLLALRRQRFTVTRTDPQRPAAGSGASIATDADAVRPIHPRAHRNAAAPARPAARGGRVRRFIAITAVAALPSTAAGMSASASPTALKEQTMPVVQARPDSTRAYDNGHLERAVVLQGAKDTMRRTPVRVASRPQAAVQIYIDGSGSIWGQAGPAVRRLARGFIADGRAVSLISFGDSVVLLGTSSSMPQVDSLLGRVRVGQKFTRLGDALLAAIDTMPTGPPTLKVFVSDFRADFRGDQGARYLAASIDSSPSPVNWDNAVASTVSEMPVDLSGGLLQLAAAFAAGALIAAILVRKHLERGRVSWLTEHVAIRVRERVKERQLRLADLVSDPVLLLGFDGDALLKTTGDRQPLQYELLATVDQNGVRIIVRPRTSHLALTATQGSR